MVKSGSFKVSQGSLAGRVGAGLGKGLGEQLPKEAERYRLSQGLKQFEQEAQGLTPLQQYTRLLPILSGTPQGAQALQALPEILKQQNMRQAYARRAGQENQLPPETESAMASQGRIGAQGQPPRNFQPQEGEFVEPGERGQPQIVETNPLDPNAIPAIPWSQRRKDQEITRALDDGIVQTIPEAIQYVNELERSELARPKAVQEQNAYFREQQDLADEAFTKHLETKLEKTKEGVYADITGENQINLKRSMYKDLKTDPNATIEDVANYWSNKALDLVKTKSGIRELAGKNIFSKITKGSENADKLKTYQKIYAETGNQEEFYNTLRSNFNLSPQGAAYLAYPRSKGVSNYIEKSKSIPYMNLSAAPAHSRKYASDIENLINREDSLLAIARDFRQKDPMFDQRAFFSQLREDQDTLGLTPRQKREIAQGESEIFPNWGDLLILPKFRGL